MSSTISFDYESINKRMSDDLSSKSEWASFLDYGVIKNLIAPISQEMAYQVQASEVYSYENFWRKARNKSSLMVQSPVHGYIVPRKKGATGTLRISTSKTFSESYVRDIEIPKFFQCSGNGLFVATVSSNVLSSSANYIDVLCVQGELQEVKFIAKGTPYEKFEIPDENFDNNYFDVYVNNNKWNYISTLYDTSDDKQVYSIETNADFSGVKICFGNDIYGDKLNAGDNITIRYISTDGENGNIYEKDVISSCVDSILINNSPIKLYVTNTTSIVGGSDYPSLEEIREVSPKVYQSGDRASSIDDYTIIIKETGNVGKVLVWGAYDTLNDKGVDVWDYSAIVSSLSNEENVVHLAILNKNFETLNEVEQSEIVTQIHNKCDPTDLIKFEYVSRIPLIFDVNANMLPNTPLTMLQVESNIRNVLSTSYSFENMNFGDNIYNSDMVRLIDEVEGVNNHLTSVSTFEDSKFDYATTIDTATYYYLNFELPLHPIAYESVRFYLLYNDSVTEENEEVGEWVVQNDGNPIAYCDNTGTIHTFTDSTNFSVYSGSLLEVQGGMLVLFLHYDNFTFNNIHKFKLHVEYKASGENLVLTNKSDIFYYYDSKINLKYS